MPELDQKSAFIPELIAVMISAYESFYLFILSNDFPLDIFSGYIKKSYYDDKQMTAFAVHSVDKYLLDDITNIVLYGLGQCFPTLQSLYIIFMIFAESKFPVNFDLTFFYRNSFLKAIIYLNSTVMIF